MQTVAIKLPERMELGNILDFAREFDYASNKDRIIIDLQSNRFFTPFTSLFIATKIKSFKAKLPKIELIFNGAENYDYLKHIGFFDMCGHEFGRHMGEAWGSQNYLPITEIKRSDLYENTTDRYEEVQDLIQRRSDRVADIMSRDKDQYRNIFNTLSYSMREIFRNVFEHSEADSLYYCIQYYKANNRVEFSVSDYGIGIRRGLSTNPNFRFQQDKEAIECSLMPSVSGKMISDRAESVWKNSGYGLYMTSRLARNGGNFVIASGNHAIYLTQKTKYNIKTSYTGTILKVNLNVDQIGDVERRLDEFRKDGDKLAARIAGTGNRPPSAMSMLLRRDFPTS